MSDIAKSRGDLLRIDAKRGYWAVAFGSIVADAVLAIAIAAAILGFLDPFAASPRYNEFTDLIARCLAVAGPLVFVVLLIVRLAVSPYSFYLKVLAGHFPGDKVWATQSSADIEQAVEALSAGAFGGSPSAKVRTTTYVVVEGDHLSFWSRAHTTLLPLLNIPRADVLSVMGGTDTDGNGQSVPITKLTLRIAGGTPLTLSMQFNPSGSKFLRARAAMRQATLDLIAWRSAP